MTSSEYHLIQEIGQLHSLSRLINDVWRQEKDRHGACEEDLYRISSEIQNVIHVLSQEARQLLESE